MRLLLARARRPMPSRPLARWGVSRPLAVCCGTADSCQEQPDHLSSKGGLLLSNVVGFPLVLALLCAVSIALASCSSWEDDPTYAKHTWVAGQPCETVHIQYDRNGRLVVANTSAQPDHICEVPRDDPIWGHSIQSSFVYNPNLGKIVLSYITWGSNYHETNLAASATALRYLETWPEIADLNDQGYLTETDPGGDMLPCLRFGSPC